jgi:CO/xanthine dehydrogenase FAD-binding subunit
MDMTCVDEIITCADPDAWRPGDSWLAGGTVLYSYGTDITRGAPTRLLDLSEAGWEPVRWLEEDGELHALEIAATCRVADIYAFADRDDLPAEVLPGLDLFAPCCDSFVASWKIWNVSTVGGNVATGLPAGPMISLLSGLDATTILLGPGGTRRSVAVTDLVLGEATTALADGELIRAFRIPVQALRQPCAFRRISLTERGRSAALLIGRTVSQGRYRLAVTASTRRPHMVDVGAGTEWPATPDGLSAAIESSVDGNWHDDVHGTPQWRRDMTHLLAHEILDELSHPDVTAHRPRVTGDITMTRSTR